MNKAYLLVSIFLIFVALAVNTFAVTETECASGRGEWTTPTISIGDDPISSKKTLQPFCQCDLGFYWNDSLKQCEDDSKLRCAQTGGAWAGNKCQCPEGTIKWTIGFGCDMPGPIPTTNVDIHSSDSNISYKVLLLISTVLLFLIGVIIYVIKKKMRRGEKNET